MQQLYHRRQVTLKRRRLEHKRQLHQSESHAVENDDQAEDEIDHSCSLSNLLFSAMLPPQAASPMHIRSAVRVL